MLPIVGNLKARKAFIILLHFFSSPGHLQGKRNVGKKVGTTGKVSVTYYAVYIKINNNSSFVYDTGICCWTASWLTLRVFVTA